jgi:nucleotidyltransferase/DNA polymerase involved in DNA repair
MRIACVHIPQLSLQCASRIDPSLRRMSAAVAVVGTSPMDPRSPVVLGCSRAAHALGARVGMAATLARGLSPDLMLLAADAQLEREAIRAIADTLLSASQVVEIGGRVGPRHAHFAIYCEVPAKTRGTSFGDRLLAHLEPLGITARIGIADDRFTAWVAASQHAPADDASIISVPRGGSPAFLAPRPLALLSISPEVAHMLESLGVRTLGEFAALPSPTVSSRAARFEADYQALARGESGAHLRPYAPEAPIREDAVIGGDEAEGLSTPAAIALLAERVAIRLAGRARCAARLDITFGSAEGERTASVSPVRDGRGVLSSAEQLAEAIGSALGDTTTSPIWRLRVVVTGEALAGDLDSASAAATAADAFGGAPTQRTFAIGSAPIAASSASHAAASATAAAEARTLAVALSTTGGAVDHVLNTSSFGLTSPLTPARDREGHRRLRRGKQQRRRNTPAVGTAVQSRLFKL